MPDALATLSAPSWRGIPFPLSSLTEEFNQDHAVHAFLYRDGVHIEATGRNATAFHLSIPFFNGVQAAPTELWAGQLLYPTVFRQFRTACIDRSTGPLEIPDIGTVQCKARDLRITYDPNVRDGARVDVTLYESVDGDELDTILSNLSSHAVAIQSANRLDSLLGQTTAPMPELAQDKTSFTDLMASYDAGTAGLGRVQSKVDSLTQALHRLDSVAYWELTATNEDMRAAVIDLNHQPSQTQRPIRTFIPTRDTPLMTIAIGLGIKATDIVTMNPRLARDPLVRAGTRIQYVSVL